MRWLTIILFIFFLLLQYRLWIGEGSLAQKVQLENKVEQQKVENEQLKNRNQVLANEVEDLKNDLEGVEEIARKDLGMVKKGETFYMVIDKDSVGKKTTENGGAEKSHVDTKENSQ